MKILSNSEYMRRITAAANQSFIDGYNLGKKHQSTGYEREFERGRITLNEYRRLAYDLPPIEVENERVSR